MIVKWNNNIVDYKCKVFLVFLFVRYKSILFFYVGLCHKKRHLERVSGAAGGRSNKERQRLQPLASVG